MYRVSLSKLFEILRKGNYHYATTELRKKELTPDKISTIEVDFTINNKDTEEVWTVNMFNIYTTDNRVLFGKLTKNGNDFTIQSASKAYTTTKPRLQENQDERNREQGNTKH